MLKEEERNKIELEEQYRNEISSKFKSKSKIDYVETITKILQGMAIVVGIIVTYITYVDQNNEKIAREEEQVRQRANEFKKTFYEIQLDYYSEAMEATSILATEEINSEDYNKAKDSFYRLYWGKLSFVEDKKVEASMVEFKKLLEEYEKKESVLTKVDLQNASLDLSHNARTHTINVWLDSTERKNYEK